MFLAEKDLTYQDLKNKWCQISLFFTLVNGDVNHTIGAPKLTDMV